MGTQKIQAERRILKKYLARYFKAREQQAILQDRLQRLKREIHPEAEGEAALSPSGIEARIQAQAEVLEQSVLEVMDILAFLPPNSTERLIMELRHLDCKPWDKIQATVYLTATPCFTHYNKALDTLLAKPEVRRIIGLSKKAAGGNS